MRPPSDPVPKRRRLGEAPRTTPLPSSAFFPPLQTHTSPSAPVSLPQTSAPPPLPAFPDFFPTASFPNIPNLNPHSPSPPNHESAAPYPHPPFISPIPPIPQNPPKRTSASQFLLSPNLRPSGDSFQTQPKQTRPSQSPNGMRRPAPVSPPSSLGTLGSIAPVAEALGLIPEESPIIPALAQVLSPSTASTRQTTAHARQSILSFRGFPPRSTPTFHALTVLSKVDLDILAWIFTVSKHGRKDDVAKRILSSLSAPLRYRTPPPTRRPPGLRNLTPVINGSLNTTAGVPVLPRVIPRASASTSNPSRNRVNMPSLTAARGNGNPSNDALLQQLEQQLHGRRFATGGAGGTSLGAFTHTVNHTPGTVQMRMSAAQHRNKLMKNAVQDALQNYDFTTPENPFNKPLNPPLGIAKRYVVFSSMQLSRGNSDPVLMFNTPPPIDPKVEPEVLGGDVQIHLRCLKVEVGKQNVDWKQAWPFPASCRVNTQSVVLNQAQRYTNGKLAGLDTATNISPFLRKYKAMSETNRVTLRRQTSNATPLSGQFVLFAQEVLVYSTDTMAKSVQEGSEKYWIEYRRLREKNGTLLPSASRFEMARQGVMQFLTDPDGLTVSSMKVSLRCPLALTRIITPVKGRRCQHVQCFDLFTFLDYSRRSSKFDCPVCNKNTAFPHQLVVSPYIEYALEKYRDCDEVEIFQDGTMVAVERKQSGVASDDDDESGNGPISHSAAQSNAKAAEIVDLTLDSDEDESAETEQPGSPPAISRREMNAVLPLSMRNSGSVPNSGIRDSSNTGNTQNMEDTIMRPARDEQESNVVQDVDEELDFSFRADFAPVSWGDPSGTEDLGHVRLQPNNPSDNWSVDVIAIDSD